jgi:predicted SprT family Zn-dependent metalloprotease
VATTVTRLEREAKKGQLVLFGLLEPEPPPDPRALPDLKALFHELNERFFQGVLSARVEWSTRMSGTAGRCFIKRRLIRISALAHQRNPRLTGATLAHEMLHLIVPNHGPKFRRLGKPLAAGLGVTWREFRYAEPWVDIRYIKYIYACPVCGREKASRKRRAISCGRCHPGVFDERFRMGLTESRAHPGPVLLGQRPANITGGE